MIRMTRSLLDMLVMRNQNANTWNSFISFMQVGEQVLAASPCIKGSSFRFLPVMTFPEDGSPRISAPFVSVGPPCACRGPLRSVDLP